MNLHDDGLVLTVLALILPDELQDVRDVYLNLLHQFRLKHQVIHNVILLSSSVTTSRVGQFSTKVYIPRQVILFVIFRDAPLLLRKLIKHAEQVLHLQEGTKQFHKHLLFFDGENRRVQRQGKLSQ